MLIVEIQECPKCGGAVDAEHVAVVELEDRRDEFFLCAFCGYGIEQSVYRDNTVQRLDFVERTEPIQFALFVERLRKAVAA